MKIFYTLLLTISFIAINLEAMNNEDYRKKDLEELKIIRASHEQLVQCIAPQYKIMQEGMKACSQKKSSEKECILKLGKSNRTKIESCMISECKRIGGCDQEKATSVSSTAWNIFCLVGLTQESDK
jgi:hypothetical protein